MQIKEIESKIDLLLRKYDSSVIEKKYELSLELINEIEKELEKLEKNEIKINSKNLH